MHKQRAPSRIDSASVICQITISPHPACILPAFGHHRDLFTLSEIDGVPLNTTHIVADVANRAAKYFGLEGDTIEVYGIKFAEKLGSCAYKALVSQEPLDLGEQLQYYYGRAYLFTYQSPDMPTVIELCLVPLSLGGARATEALKAEFVCYEKLYLEFPFLPNFLLTGLDGILEVYQPLFSEFEAYLDDRELNPSQNFEAMLIKACHYFQPYFCELRKLHLCYLRFRYAVFENYQNGCVEPAPNELALLVGDIIRFLSPVVWPSLEMSSTPDLRLFYMEHSVRFSKIEEEITCLHHSLSVMADHFVDMMPNDRKDFIAAQRLDAHRTDNFPQEDSSRDSVQEAGSSSFSDNQLQVTPRILLESDVAPENSMTTPKLDTTTTDSDVHDTPDLLKAAKMIDVPQAAPLDPSMPPCVERSLLQLMRIFELLTPEYCSALCEPSAIASACDLFVRQMKDEGYESDLDYLSGILDTLRLYSNFSDHELAASLRATDFSLQLKELQTYLLKIRPFDAALARSMIDKALLAQHCVSGQRVVMIIGATGVGKSTTVLYLAGAWMKNERDEATNLRHLGPSPSLEKQLGVNPNLDAEIVSHLLKVESSPRMKSVTRFMAAVPIRLDGDTLFYLCDSPGFGDTEGAEYDLANNVGLVYTISRCESVAIVLQFDSRGVGARFEHLRSQVVTLTRLLPQVEDHLRSFTYLFNRFSESDYEQIPQRLRSLLRSLNEFDRMNLSFVSVLNDMIDKFPTLHRLEYYGDDFEAERRAYLTYLNELPTLNFPAEKFRVEVTEITRSKIYQQAECVRFGVLRALKCENYDLASYKLSSLLLLQDYQPSLRDVVVDRTLEETRQYFENYYSGVMKLFLDRCLADSGVLSRADVDSLLCAKTFLAKSSGFQRKFLEKNGYYPESIDYTVASSVLKLAEIPGDLASNLMVMKIRFDKLLLLLPQFPDTLSVYESLARRIIDYFSEQVKIALKLFEASAQYDPTPSLPSAKSHESSSGSPSVSIKSSRWKKFETNDFQNFEEHLKRLDASLCLFRGLEEFARFREAIRLHVESRFAVFRRRLAEFFVCSEMDCDDEYLRLKELNDVHLNEIAHYLKLAESLHYSSHLQPFIRNNFFNCDFLEPLVVTVVTNFNQLYENYADSVKTINPESARSLQAFFSNMKFMIQLSLPSFIDSTEFDKCKRNYSHLLNTLIEKFVLVRQQAEIKLGEYVANPTSHTPMLEFYRKFQILLNATWIDNYRRNTISDSIDRIRDVVESILQGIQLNMAYTPFELDNVANAPQLASDIRLLSKLYQSVTIVAVDNRARSAVDNLRKSLEEYREKITEEFFRTKFVDLEKLGVTYDLNKLCLNQELDKLKRLENTQQGYLKLHFSHAVLEESGLESRKDLIEKLERKKLARGQIEARINSESSAKLNEIRKKLAVLCDAGLEETIDAYLAKQGTTRLEFERDAEALAAQEMELEDVKEDISVLEPLLNRYDACLLEKDEKALAYLRNECSEFNTTINSIEDLSKLIEQSKMNIRLENFDAPTFSRFDFDHVTKGIRYLSVVKDVFLDLAPPELKGNYESVEEKFANYLLSYGNFLQQQISDTIEALMILVHNGPSQSSLSPNSLLHSNVRTIVRTFGQIQEILKHEALAARVFGHQMYPDDFTDPLRQFAEYVKSPGHSSAMRLLVLTECSDMESLPLFQQVAFKHFSKAREAFTQELTAMKHFLKNDISLCLQAHDYTTAVALVGSSHLTGTDKFSAMSDFTLAVKKLMKDVPEAKAGAFIPNESLATSEFISQYRHLVDASAACAVMKRDPSDSGLNNDLATNLRQHLTSLERIIVGKFNAQSVLIGASISRLKSFSHAAKIHGDCINCQARLNIPEVEKCLENCEAIVWQHLDCVVADYCTPQALQWSEVVENLYCVSIDYSPINKYHDAAEKIQAFLSAMLEKKFNEFDAGMGEELDAGTFPWYLRRFQDLTAFFDTKGNYKILPRKVVNSFLARYSDAEVKMQGHEARQRESQLQALHQRNIPELIKKYKEFKEARLASYCRELEATITKNIKSLCDSLQLQLRSDNPEVSQLLNDSASLLQWKPLADSLAEFYQMSQDISFLLNDFFRRRLLLSARKICGPLTTGTLDVASIKFYCGILVDLYSNASAIDESVHELFRSGGGIGFDFAQQTQQIEREILEAIEVVEIRYQEAYQKRDPLEINNFYVAFCRMRPLFLELLFYFRQTGERYATLNSKMESFVSHPFERELEDLSKRLKAPLLANIRTLEMRKIGQAKRDDYFCTLNASAQVLERFTITHWSYFSMAEYRSCILQFQEKVEFLYRALLDSMPRISDSALNARIYNDEFNIMASVKKNVWFADFNFDGFDLNIMAVAIAGKIDSRKYATNMKDLPGVLHCLEKLKIFTEVDAVRSTAQRELEQFLSQFKREGGNIFALENALIKCSETWALEITQDFAIFKGAKDAYLREKLITYNSEEMSSALKSLNPALETVDTLIRSLYRSFSSQFDQMVSFEMTRLYTIEKSLITDATFTDFENLRSIIRGSMKSKWFENFVFKKNEPIPWTPPLKRELVNLLANIFALLSLRYSAREMYEHHFDYSTEERRKPFLWKPHATQVLAIFRLLGLDSQREVLDSHLVQIGTGEGKTVTLAIVAIVLALHGIQVNCACYSRYLSARDFAEFEDLFLYLGLEDRIHYGTFRELCETTFNRRGDLRAMTERFFLPGKAIKAPVTRKKTDVPYVLLVDEVDVFLSEKYFGAIYTASVKLEHESFKKLAKFIWKERSKLSSEELLLTPEYLECQKNFSRMGSLISEAASEMLFAAKNHLNHKTDTETRYKLDDLTGQIQYFDHLTGSYTGSLNFGYHTMFAYFSELESQPTREKSIEPYLEQCIGLTFRCGTFSYAECAHYFGAILGASGTLPPPDSSQYKIVSEVYNIERYTVLPSVFSKGRDVFDYGEEVDLHILAKKDYYRSILRDIVGNVEVRKRPVIVFFESEEKLLSFFNSDVFNSHNNGALRDLCKFYDDNTADADATKLILSATLSGALTLATREKGRGTDFRVSDAVSVSGGLHVIQTFLSLDISEELQIKGRTARMSCKGSYEMLLLDTDLEYFGVSPVDIEKMKKDKTKYATLDSFRNAKFAQQYEAKRALVNQAKVAHEESMQFLESMIQAQVPFVDAFFGLSSVTGAIKLVRDHFLKEPDFDRYFKVDSPEFKSCLDYLMKNNRGMPIEFVSYSMLGPTAIKSRTLLLLDATLSMSILIETAKSAINEVFSRANKILQEQRLLENSFSVQLAVYRNYDCKPDYLFENSSWESRPEKLNAFLNKVAVTGGWQEEAIEIGLAHAASEQKSGGLSQVILIGDAPANSEEQVIAKRKLSDTGEAKWSKSKFGARTTWQQEIALLRAPVHTVCIPTDDPDWTNKTKENFMAMSALTNGQTYLLNISKIDGGEELIHLICAQILESTGGKEKGAALKKAYENKYRSSVSNPVLL